jgi:microcystin degradation protein MlrC
MAETGLRAARLLAQRVAHGKPFKRAMRRVPFLIPVNGMCTLVEPARGMYGAIEALEKTVVSLSFAPGFPASDFVACGPAVWGYALDQASAKHAVDALYTQITHDEARWGVSFLSPDEAVLEAIAASRAATKPVVIADTQDNPGVGGDSNTMGMVRALLRHRARDAAVGVIWDEQAARAAHRAGVGARIRLALGGGSNVPGDSPVEGEFEVESVSDGRFRFDGPMLQGMKGELGPTACLRIEGLRIVVSSIKMQVFDRNLFRVAGIEPEHMKILVVKSSVHFRADFEPITARILVAKAPGPMAADPADLPWRHLDARMRLRPKGPTLEALRASAA